MMNAAAIGLIGVIVGALLAGTINLVLDRRRRLARAKAAGRLIGVELRVVDEKITSAIDSAKPPSGAANVATASERRPPVDTSGWWLGDLPMDAWRTNQSHLAIDVRPRVLEMLARAYGLCAVLNDEHVASAIDAAIIISNDSDLQFPVSYARGLVPVGLVNPSPNYLAGALRGQPSEGVGNHWRHRLSAADLQSCQLPHAVASFARPSGW
jgi:hypothetical protein